MENGQNRDDLSLNNNNELEEYIRKHVHKKTRLNLIKILGAFLICIAVFFVGFYFANIRNGIFGEKVAGVKDGVVTMQTVKKILYPASDLVSGKYFYKNAVSDEDPISIGKNNLPGTTNKYVFTYEGTINAGYDLSKIDVDVDDDNKIITVKMPKMKIISSEVDDNSFKVVYKTKSAFNNNDVERNADVRAKCNKAMVKKAKSDVRFIKMTQSSARNTIKAFIKAASVTKDYTVKVEFMEGDNDQ